MEAKSNENKNQRQNCKLDDRYGEIGISAVAAAIRCRAEERAVNRSRQTQYESD